MKSFEFGADVVRPFAGMWQYGGGLGFAVCGDRGSQEPIATCMLVMSSDCGKIG